MSSRFQAEFDTRHLEADLRGRTLRGGTVTLASQGLRFALQMGSTVVLARLLSPADYGLVGMTSVVTGFIELFKDLGLSEATVQQSTINHRQVSTLFWLNCLVGLGLTLVVIAVSPLAARLYQEPRVIGIMNGLSVNFFLSSIATQHIALLKRQMRFTALAILNIVSMAAGVVGAVVAAKMGAGYWALVLMYITSVLTYSVGGWATCRWRPGKPAFGSGIGSMLRFGGNLTGFNVVNYFSRNLDNVLIGRFWGSVELGLYAKAYQLILLPINQINGPITNVAMPALSRLQENPEKYSRYYYKAVLMICAVGMPITGFLFAASREIILIVLGTQWLGSVSIFQVLMPAAFIGTFNVATGWAYQSLGRTDRQFRWGLISSGIKVMAFIIGIQWGAMGIAASYSLSEVILLLPRLMYCFNGTFLNTSSLVRVLVYPFMASIIPAFLLLYGTVYIDHPSIVVTALIKALIFVAGYIFIWLLMPDGKTKLKDIMRILIQLKK